MKQEKNQKFTWNKYFKVLIQIPGTYKKYLGRTDIPTNAQNNCIKVIWFPY